MEIMFEVRVGLVLNHNENTGGTKLKSTKYNLKVDDYLEASKYIDEDNLPNKEGSVIVTTTLVHGLIGNIHMAHENGYRDSAEHLRWIIAELEKGFASVAEVKKGTFDTDES